jgi:hypothetical protein
LSAGLVLAHQVLIRERAKDREVMPLMIIVTDGAGNVSMTDMPPQEEALLLDLESVPQLGIRRSLKPIALPSDALEYLSPRPRMAYFFEPARELELESGG